MSAALPYELPEARDAVNASITSKELRDYLDDPRFEKPERVDGRAWRWGVERARQLLQTIFADLNHSMGDRMEFRPLCREVDERLVKAGIQTTEGLEAVRTSLRAWLQIQLRLSTNPQFGDLIAQLKERDGVLALGDIESNPQTKSVGDAIRNAIQFFTRDAGGSAETAHELIEEFLARAAALEEVHIFGQQQAQAEKDEEEEAANDDEEVEDFPGGITEAPDIEVSLRESREVKGLSEPIQSLEDLRRAADQERPWVHTIVTPSNSRLVTSTKARSLPCRKGDHVSFLVVLPTDGRMRGVILEGRSNARSKPFRVTTDVQVRNLGLFRDVEFKAGDWLDASDEGDEKEGGEAA